MRTCLVFGLLLVGAGCSADTDEARAELSDGPVGQTESAITQTSAPWHLDRMDQAALPLNTTYTYSCTGAVPIYIISTGIATGHSEVSGRASFYSGVPNSGLIDCDGEGTAMAAIAGGTTKGVAKAATLKSVSIKRCLGSGGDATLEQQVAVINDLQFVEKPAVVVLTGNQQGGVDDNLPLPIRNSLSLVANSGAIVILGVKPGTPSPGSFNTKIIKVASTNSADGLTNSPVGGLPFDLRAPGTSVSTAFYMSASLMTNVSGNQYAAAAAAGAAAQYLQLNPTATAAAVKTALQSSAVPLPSGPQKLVQRMCP